MRRLVAIGILTCALGWAGPAVADECWQFDNFLTDFIRLSVKPDFDPKKVVTGFYQIDVTGGHCGGRALAPHRGALPQIDAAAAGALVSGGGPARPEEISRRGGAHARPSGADPAGPRIARAPGRAGGVLCARDPGGAGRRALRRPRPAVVGSGTQSPRRAAAPMTSAAAATVRKGAAPKGTA